MLLSTEQLKRLKQVNVSQDAEKTKERIKKDFQAATNAVKAAIVELSGQKRTSFYRAYETGAAHARIILAMAASLNVSPFYYTGELDERAYLQNDDIIRFLENLGYAELAAELRDANPQQPEEKPKLKYTRRPKAETAAEPNAKIPAQDEKPEPEAETAVDTIDVKITLPENAVIHETVQSMTEDEAVLLLRALFVKAKAGGAHAEMLKIIERCLLV
jgi:hypothetical protein